MADVILCPLHHHGLGPAGAAEDHPVAAGLSLDQQLFGAAHLALVDLLLDRPGGGDQPFEPLLADLARDELAGGQARRGRAVARAVFIREGFVEPDVAEEGQGLLEIRLALAGERYDDVGGEGHVGQRAADQLDLFHEGLGGVAAEHAAQHAVAPRLHGQVELLAHGGLARHDLDELFGDVVGVRRGEAHAADAGDARDAFEQPREGPVAPVARVAPLVRVDRLSEEGDLGDAAADGLPRLGEDLFRVAVLLGAAHVRHDAEGAAVIAAALDGDPGGDVRAAALFEPAVVLVEGEVEDGEAVAGGMGLAGGSSHLVERRAQAAVAVRPHDEIDVGRLFEQIVAHALGHAAGDAQNHAGT